MNFVINPLVLLKADILIIKTMLVQFTQRGAVVTAFAASFWGFSFIFAAVRRRRGKNWENEAERRENELVNLSPLALNV